MLADFKAGSCPVLVATDVASRGLDVKVSFFVCVFFPETSSPVFRPFQLNTGSSR